MRRIVAMLAIITGLIGLALATYLYLSPGASAAPVAPIEGEAVSSSLPYFDLEVERPAPDFTLINQDGETVSLSDYQGSFVVLDFIYTSCRTVCPLLTANLLRVENELGDHFGSRVYFISVTIDPEYDTPERFKAYAETYGADLSGWTFLTGEPDTVYQVLDDYLQTFEEKAPQDIDHTALTVLIDPSGVERHRYWGTVFPPEMVVGHIETLGREGAQAATLSVAAKSVPAANGPTPSQAEMESYLGLTQRKFQFLIDEEEAERFVGKLTDKLLAQGWTETTSRSGFEQEAHFFQWGDEAFIGVGRNLDAVVVLQDSDVVQLWTDFFEQFNLYCCGS